MINCGAFGSTGATRRGMLAVLDGAQAGGKRNELDEQMGQGSIFDLVDAGRTTADGRRSTRRPTRRSRAESSIAELLAIEKESIGLFISEHPLKRVREALRPRPTVGCARSPSSATATG